MAALFGLLGVLVIFGMVILPFINPYSGQELENYAADVSILTSDMYFAPTGGTADAKTLAIVGQGSNTGEKKLGNVYLHVEVFNKDGKLIDMHNDTCAANAGPKEEFPFKIEGGHIHLPESEYASHKVTVTGAWESY